MSPLRNAFENVATEDTLAQIATQLDGTNLLGYVGDSMLLTVAAGQLYIGGAGRLVLAEAGNVRAVISNPTGSDTMVYIVRAAFYSSTEGYAHFHRNPTVGVPTTAPTTSNALLSNVAPSKAEIGFDLSLTTQLSGGTSLGTVVGMAPSIRTALDLPPLILPPGNSWGFNVPYSSSADFLCSVYWVERPV